MGQHSEYKIESPEKMKTGTIIWNVDAIMQHLQTLKVVFIHSGNEENLVKCTIGRNWLKNNIIEDDFVFQIWHIVVFLSFQKKTRW